MSASSDDNLSIPEALLEAKRLHGAAPSYHTAWCKIVTGEIPAERIGRGYAVKRAVVPQIAALARIIHEARRHEVPGGFSGHRHRRFPLCGASPGE